MSNNVKAILAVAALALAWSGAASAAIPANPWTNFVYSSTVTSVAGEGAASANLNEPVFTRWHQNTSAVYTPENPCWVQFDLGAGNEQTISYVRWYNLAGGGNADGPFVYHLEYRDANGDWKVITDIGDEFGNVTTSSTAGDQLAFAPISTSALRFVLTQSNAGNNFRLSNFEFFEFDQRTVNLCNAPGATLIWSNAYNDNTVDMLALDSFTNGRANPADGLPGNPRWDSGQYTGGRTDSQFITLTLPEEYMLKHLRITAEDDGRSIGEFSIQYLLADGVTWATVPGLGNLTGQPNIAEYDLSTLPATTGLRMHVTVPSTNTGDNQLRLCQFEVFGTPVPEPVTMSLLALGGLALLRRRK